MLGGRRAARGRTATRHFGSGRERYFWAFVVALVLFTFGGVFAVYEGVSKFRHPHETSNMPVAIAILVVAIVLESFSLRTALHEARSVRRENQSWWRFIRDAKQPELPVVLLEDFGALIGLVLALAGVTMARITHDARWDASGSIAIGILLIAIAVILVIELKGLLVGESADEIDHQRLHTLLAGSRGVLSVLDLRTEYVGPDEILVAAKLEFDHSMSGDDVSQAINEMEDRIRADFKERLLLFIEPDLRR
jgi:cation diffusion facilitator family transporter